MGLGGGDAAFQGCRRPPWRLAGIEGVGPQLRARLTSLSGVS